MATHGLSGLFISLSAKTVERLDVPPTEGAKGRCLPRGDSGSGRGAKAMANDRVQVSDWIETQLKGRSCSAELQVKWP